MYFLPFVKILVLLHLIFSWFLLPGYLVCVVLRYRWK